MEKELTILKEKTAKMTRDNETELNDKDDDDDDDELKIELEKENNELKEQLEIMEEKMEESKNRIKSLMNLQTELELQGLELHNAKMQVEKLEYEKASWEESKQLTSKAARAIDLEKELLLAKETICAMRESIKGKLLLEEQISSIKKRSLFFIISFLFIYILKNH